MLVGCLCLFREQAGKPAGIRSEQNRKRHLKAVLTDYVTIAVILLIRHLNEASPTGIRNNPDLNGPSITTRSN